MNAKGLLLECRMLNHDGNSVTFNVLAEELQKNTDAGIGALIRSRIHRAFMTDEETLGQDEQPTQAPSC
jgi:hypothetical protein